jgi:hypothetical protein
MRGSIFFSNCVHVAISLLIDDRDILIYLVWKEFILLNLYLSIYTTLFSIYA